MVIILAIIAAYCTGFCTKLAIDRYKVWKLWKKLEPAVREQAEKIQEERRVLELVDAAAADVKRRAQAR